MGVYLVKLFVLMTGENYQKRKQHQQFCLLLLSSLPAYYHTDCVLSYYTLYRYCHLVENERKEVESWNKYCDLLKVVYLQNEVSSWNTMTVSESRGETGGYTSKRT